MSNQDKCEQGISLANKVSCSAAENGIHAGRSNIIVLIDFVRTN
jgi:hypothetical protein